MRTKAFEIDNGAGLLAVGDERRSDTRKRLLDVAARHFGEHGYSGTSLRAIQRELGVNPATIHYHFGSKDALYRAVVASSLDLVQARRRALLRAISAEQTGNVRLKAILHAYLAPHLEYATSASGYNYARILALVQAQVRDAAADMFDIEVAPVRMEFISALGQIFPSASTDRIFEVLAMAVANMAMMPIGLSEQSLDSERMARAIADCVDYTAAGFERLCGPLLK